MRLSIFNELLGYLNVIAVCFTFRLSQVASPCLRYLLALQVHLIRAAVLHQSTLDDDDDDRDSKSSNTDNTEDSLPELQGAVLSLAEKVFRGAYEVSGSRLKCCKGINI